MGLDTVELVMAVEHEFEIEIPNSEAVMMERVGDMHAFVVTALCKRAEPALIDADRIWARLKDIVDDHLGVPPEIVVPEARFVYDLGAD